jgi:hypothetical protein
MMMMLSFTLQSPSKVILKTPLEIVDATIVATAAVRGSAPRLD